MDREKSLIDRNTWNRGEKTTKANRIHTERPYKESEYKKTDKEVKRSAKKVKSEYNENIPAESDEVTRKRDF